MLKVSGLSGLACLTREYVYNNTNLPCLKFPSHVFLRREVHVDRLCAVRL